MGEERARDIALSLIKSNNHALIGTVSINDYPNIKALTKMKNDGLKTFYFSTNSISTKVQQIKHNAKGCVYFFDPMLYIGVMLEGTLEITNDLDEANSTGYKPEALVGFDYCTIKFTAVSVNVYSDFNKETFDV